ncbi:MAG: phosphohistidine phosphatase SixA [Nitrospirales bacterium]|nr:MAG: phosphohistidine phosphatase SixA [Nitrospirales bacterium]
MKTLYLVRHAEASAQRVNRSDLSRQLSQHGEDEAARMGTRLRQRLKPDIVISSHAVRAKTTAQILAKMIDYAEGGIQFDERIYEGEPKDLMSVIQDVNAVMACVMLVGHNPALTQFVKSLAHCAIPNMCPCSMAVLQVSIDSWDDVGRASAELLDFDYPDKDVE